MATITTNTVIDHTSDAGYVTWRDEFLNSLISAGAVRTSDTGQFTIGSGTRPSTNTTSDYAVIRTPDSSLYVKLNFGTGGTTTTPSIKVTVGTGSNGSGVISGQTSTQNDITVSGAPGSTTTQYISRFCVLGGYIGVSWKESGSSGGAASMGFVAIGKTVDANQNITSDGFGVIRMMGSGLACQSVRSASPPSTQVESRTYILFAGAVTSSIDSSGNNQAYLPMLNVKDVQPFLWTAGIIQSELGYGASFTTAMIGSTARTYIGISSNNTLMSPTGATPYGLAMLWE